MRWNLFFQSFFATLFILYCVEAGIFLMLLPWKEVWDRILLAVPIPGLRSLLAHPVGRSAVSGFGLIHLVWGAHDLEALLTRRRLGGQETNP